MQEYVLHPPMSFCWEDLFLFPPNFPPWQFMLNLFTRKKFPAQKTFQPVSPKKTRKSRGGDLPPHTVDGKNLANQLIL